MRRGLQKRKEESVVEHLHRCKDYWTKRREMAERKLEEVEALFIIDSKYSKSK